VTNIHLVRHGQTNWNLERRIQGQTESTLTDLGSEQALAIGAILKDTAFDSAYASSSIRARDTAQHIVNCRAPEQKKLDLILDDQLREIFLGAWEGNLYDDIKEQDPVNHDHFFGDPSQFNVPGAETFLQTQERAITALEKIIAQEQGKTILLVSHGVWIKSVLTYLENRPLNQFWLPPKMTNCCHSILTHDGSDEFSLRNFKIQQYAGLMEW